MPTRLQKWWSDWCEAFEAYGFDDDTARDLANECETWATNNPRMTWQEVFDAVHLTKETEDAEETVAVKACPKCGGDGRLLGNLGHVAHFRCRQCGTDFNNHGEYE